MQEVSIMSKYGELCEAYSVARKNYFDYWNECADFVTDLMNGLRAYFEMPPENLKFIPLKDKPEFGKSYSAKESMILEQDTFWYVGVMMKLCSIEEDQPEETLIAPLLVKKTDGSFTIKLGPQSQEFHLNKDNQNDYHAFYDFVFNQIKENYKDRLHKFLEKIQSERRIGFVSE